MKFLLLVPFLAPLQIASALSSIAVLKFQKEDAMTLAELISANDVTVKEGTARLVTGSLHQAGSFSDGNSAIRLDKGVVLSTSGNVGDSTCYCDEMGLPGDRRLQWNLLGNSPDYTHDAVNLEFEFTCPDPNKRHVVVDYVWASLEYPNEPNSRNDAMGIFLNGAQVALVDGIFVSIGTFFEGSNFKEYIQPGSGLDVTGLSVPLKTVTKKGKKVNKIQFVVVDGGDEAIASYLFILKDSLKCVSAPS